MRPALLVAAVLSLSAVRTFTVLRVQRESKQDASRPFIVALAFVNILLFGFLATLVP